MFKDITELKEFITWCKDNKILAGNVGEVSFQFHDSVFFPEEKEVNLNTLDENVAVDNFEKAQSTEEDEELLMWST